MHNHSLTVGLFGLNTKCTRAIISAPVPACFSLHFIDGEVATASTVAQCNIAIAATTEGSIATLAEAIHAQQSDFRAFILVTDDTQADLVLGTVDDVWPTPLSPDRAAWEFTRLLTTATHQIQ